MARLYCNYCSSEWEGDEEDSCPDCDDEEDVEVIEE